jgi:hypothetical protein
MTVEFSNQRTLGTTCPVCGQPADGWTETTSAVPRRPVHGQEWSSPGPTKVQVSPCGCLVKSARWVVTQQLEIEPW